MERLVHFILLSMAAGSAAGSLMSCGYCICERSSISCDFNSVRSSVKPGPLRLSEFIPTSTGLAKLGIDPLNFDDLYVNCKNSPQLVNQSLTRDILSSFSRLKFITIVRCDLTTIESDAFEGLYSLEKFDASDNNLGLLPPRLFGRRSLSSVKLSENRRLRLDPQAFRGLALERLVLSRCQLTEFPLSALFPIKGLRELTLSENEIRLVPIEARVLIANLTVLYLDGNPLECSCVNRWLRESVDWARLSPSVSRTSKLPTCKTPFSLMDIELTKVEPSKFVCPPPRIASVDLRVAADSAYLQCSAVDPGQSISANQKLTWSYRHQLVDSSLSTSAVAPVGPQFVKVVRRRPGSLSDRLIVFAESDDGSRTAINVSVHWPTPTAAASWPSFESSRMKPAATTAMTSQPSEASRRNKINTIGVDNLPAIPERTDDKSPQDYYAAKQFTLVEMIVAVIGTFMATSLVFLLCCQFARWYRRRDRKRWLPGNGGYAPGTAYGYSLHQPQQTASLSQHEYDVPRLDHQPPVQHQLPPTLPLKLPVSNNPGHVAGSNEFLDFSNPRLKYSV